VLTNEHVLIYSDDMPVTPTKSRAVSDADQSCEERHAADPEALERMSALLLPFETVQQVADVFKLLGDPTRVRLVDVLTQGERCVCDLAALVGLSESAVSHQLRLLRSARLVRVRRAGRMAYYALDDHHVVGLLHDTRKHVEEDARS
jgi:DNA-binding transcriptional ArsR family regulator